MTLQRTFEPMGSAAPKAPTIGWGATVTALIGVVLTIIATGLLALDQDRSRQRLFDAMSQDIEHRLLPHLLVDHDLRATRAMIEAAGGLDALRADQYSVYAQSRNIGQEFPGTRGIAVARRVPSGTDASAIAALRSRGWPVSKLWSLGPSSAERYVVVAAYPREPNYNAIGGDLASEARRADAIAYAVRTGMAAITAPIELIESDNRYSRGYLTLLPVYNEPAVPRSEAERRREAAGVVLMPVEIEPRMELFRWPRDQIGLKITDITDPARPIALYQSDGFGNGNGLDKRIPVQALNRQWQIELVSRSGFERSVNVTPWWLVAAIGLLITLAASTAAWWAERSMGRIRSLNGRLQHQAKTRKTELEEARSSALAYSRQIITMIEENPQGIALVTFDPFRVDEANRRFHDLIPDFAKIETLLRPQLDAHRSTPERAIEFTTICSVSRWLRFACSPLDPTPSGQARYLVMVEDVTTEHEQRLMLDEALTRLHIASETAQIGIWYWTFSDNSVRWDDRMFRIFGRTEEERRNPDRSYEYWSDCVHPEDLGPAEQALSYAMESDSDWAHNYRVICANGDIRTIEAYGTHRRDERGKSIGMLGVCRDATERLQLEAELIAANRVAEEANQAKDQFLANVSHELRTPMNAILGLLQILERGQLNATQRLHVIGAQRAASALLRILNDILDFSRFESGMVELVSEPVSLQKMLDAALELYGEAAKTKGIHLAGRFIGDCDRSYWGDELRLGQVLHNLVDNAIKFTAKGEVEIVISCLPGTTSEETIRFEVRDTGTGIGAKNPEHLFLPFVQAEPSVARSFGGSGLGLAICQQLVQAMGGKIGAENNVSAGSTFWFEVPLQYGGDARLEHLRRLQPGRALLLIAQDDIAGLLRGQLSSWGLTSTVTAEVDDIAPAIEAGMAASDPVTMLVIDHRSLGEQSADVMQRIRHLQQSRSIPRLPMIVLQDNKGPAVANVEEALMADAVLPTPVDMLALYEAISDLQRKGFTDRAEAMPDVPDELLIAYLGRCANSRILLVEDNRTNQEVALSLLEQFGLRADVARNGQEAVAALAEADYALVLMDIHMPVMNGLDATRLVRAGNRNAAVPIIAMTAAAFPEDRRSAFAAGMSDFISKPIDVQRLAAAMVRWLKPDAADKSVPVPAEAGASARIDNLDQFDLPSLERRIGGGPDRVRRVLGAFREDFAAWPEEAGAAAAQGDVQTLYRLVHSLKGAAGGVSASLVADQAARLDQLLRQDSPGTTAAPIQSALGALTAALTAALKQLDRKLSPLADDSTAAPAGGPLP